MRPSAVDGRQEPRLPPRSRCHRHWLERRRQLTDLERERERRRAYIASYRQSDTYKAAKRRYRKRHREQLNTNNRAYKARHRERLLAARRAAYAAARAKG
jgi:hypothetical protein